MFNFFLSSGLFLGWSLGANDASNVFGTAVGSKMVRFRTAAICCSIFVILGAVISGAGASHTLGRLGAVNAVAGAIIVAFAAALSVYVMTKARYPVSTSQAIVGAIIGWNLFSGSATDYHSLTKIVLTWIACPILSGIFAVLLYKTIVVLIKVSRINMFGLDSMTRSGLIIIGAFGSYSLGANNIANVMGVFIPVSPFHDLTLGGSITITAGQQLFFIGGLAIAVGVFTYSKRVMTTVGEGIVDLSPVAAFVVVSAHSMVLFIFASQGLEHLLKSRGLPTIPLVPVSSSQAIVGAVIGIGLLKGGAGLRWRTVGGIASSWVSTPLIAALLSFISLFFMQNVFMQKTFRPVSYIPTIQALERLDQAGLPEDVLSKISEKKFANATEFKKYISRQFGLTREYQDIVMALCEYDEIMITPEGIAALNPKLINEEQKRALQKLEGRIFVHKWQLDEALAECSDAWKFKKNDEEHNKLLRTRLSHVYLTFQNYGTPEADRGVRQNSD